MVLNARSMLPTADERPMLDFPLVCRALGVSQSKGYELIAGDDFPVGVHRIGGRWKVRTVDLRRYLGLDESAAAS